MCFALRKRFVPRPDPQIQSEVLDYVFHGDCRYVTNEEDPRVGYVGGASCRGLKKERNRQKTVSAVRVELHPYGNNCVGSC